MSEIKKFWAEKSKRAKQILIVDFKTVGFVALIGFFIISMLLTISQEVDNLSISIIVLSIIGFTLSLFSLGINIRKSEELEKDYDKWLESK